MQRFLEVEFAPAVAAIRADPHIANDVKRRIEKSLETICSNAQNIPSVCCHGDLWAGNILWQRGQRRAIVLDWGAARWPGLPCVDLCRFALANVPSNELIAELITRHCYAIDLDPGLVPALYDLYKLFVKAELDEAFKLQPDGVFNPFLGDNDTPALRLSWLLEAHSMGSAHNRYHYGS